MRSFALASPRCRGWAWTSPLSRALKAAINLTSLRGIPESVAAISCRAFYKCEGLTVLEGLPGSFSATGISSERVFYGCGGLTSLQGLSKNITELGIACFCNCSGITSLRGGEKVTVIGVAAFSGCHGLATLQGLSRNVTAMGDPDSTIIIPSVFRGCTSLGSIGPGFSPSCFVDPGTFDDCPALLAAAEAKGFSAVIEWGRRHWLAVPRRRFIVLSSVSQVRSRPPTANSPPPLLSLLVGALDDLVRVIVGFMGEGEEESGAGGEGEVGAHSFQAEQGDQAAERADREEEGASGAVGGAGGAREGADGGAA